MKHLVRYVGWYTNRARGERAKALAPAEPRYTLIYRLLMTMTEEATNLVLEHLRAIRGTLDRHTEEFHFLKERVNSIERQVAGLHGDMAGLHSDGATVNAQLESIKRRLDQIEKRLDLTSA